jgi:hypothetical protein
MKRMAMVKVVSPLELTLEPTVSNTSHAPALEVLPPRHRSSLPAGRTSAGLAAGLTLRFVWVLAVVSAALKSSTSNAVNVGINRFMASLP